jgi:7,8-dihydro-6-hydroxymethylpterin-pyrophosphokinase
MWSRRFVMAPLIDVAPDVAPPGWERQVEGEVRQVGRLDDEDS